MLVKFNLPESPEYPCGKQVWIRVEDIDRVEGHSDWKYKETKVYLKSNPTEPFVVIKKAIVDVVEPIERALDPLGGAIQNLTQAVERLIEQLPRLRNEAE